jgi:Fic family protein
MIFSVPPFPPEYEAVVGRIVRLREHLRFVTSDNLNRWKGFIARMAYAQTIHQSNSMEGINATFEDAVAVVDDEAPENPADENSKALFGYRDAMDYVIQLAKAKNHHQQNKQTINALHFMVTKYDLKKSPGQFREGPVHVTNSESQDIVYEGPPAEMVPDLVQELLDWLNNPAPCNVLIKAAMAHLNLTMIHPYRDGNGRMARILQTFVLAQDGILDPRFSSIEEYVGRNSGYYYSVLAEVGQGSWNPQNSALPWIKFCLRAHYWQAESLLRRLQQSASLWTELEKEAKKCRLPDRTMNALMKAAYGIKVRNPSYRQESDISVQVAKLDLKNLVSCGLLEPKGETRGRYYVATEALQTLRNQSKISQAPTDPFVDKPEITEGPTSEVAD